MDGAKHTDCARIEDLASRGGKIVDRSSVCVNMVLRSRTLSLKLSGKFSEIHLEAGRDEVPAAINQSAKE